MENDNELITQNDTEETVNDTIELEEVADDDDEVITVSKKKWTEALAQREHLQKKLEKVSASPRETEHKSSDLSSKDLLALMNAKVQEEDVDEIVEYARFKKINIAEAMKTQVVQNILKDKDEKRKIADATYTGTPKRTTTKITDDVLLDKSKRGELPESNEDIARLVRARKGLKN